MRKIKLYIALSLNGKIAEKDGRVDWLEKIPNPQKDDYGFEDFKKTIDTTIQGYTTYKQIIDWDIEWPYEKTENYVLTRKTDIKDTKDVTFLQKNPIAKIQELKQEKGKDIWLIGGGTVNTLLLNEGLIDTIQIFVMPIILPKGIEVFESLPKETLLTLKNTKKYESGAMELVYDVG